MRKTSLNWKGVLFIILIFTAFILGDLYQQARFKAEYRNSQSLIEAFHYIDYQYFKQLTPEQMKELNYAAIQSALWQLRMYSWSDYSSVAKVQETAKWIEITPDQKIKFVTPPNISKPVQKKIIGNIGYLKIKTFFGANIYQETEQAIKYFNEANIQGLIIDLRNNSGGDNDILLKMADLFLEKDRIICIQLRRLGPLPLEKERKAEQKIEFQKPIIILVNQKTASASEIFVSALGYHKKATIIGLRTYGKAVGQSLFLLKDDLVLALTTFQWLTPAHQPIHNRGITPDIVIQDPELQLQKAIEILKAKISPPKTD